jgi:Flp pilus assembly protein TadD
MNVTSITRDLLAYAANAFQTQQYPQAVMYLEEVVDACPDDWHSRLCLGVSYVKAGSIALAKHQFLYIAENCPTTRMREWARDELKMVMRTEQKAS